MERAQKRFAPRITAAIVQNDPDLALGIYEDTLSLPQTSTEAELLKVQGENLN